MAARNTQNAEAELKMGNPCLESWHLGGQGKGIFEFKANLGYERPYLKIKSINYKSQINLLAPPAHGQGNSLKLRAVILGK